MAIEAPMEIEFEGCSGGDGVLDSDSRALGRLVRTTAMSPQHEPSLWVRNDWRSLGVLSAAEHVKTFAHIRRCSNLGHRATIRVMAVSTDSTSPETESRPGGVVPGFPSARNVIAANTRTAHGSAGDAMFVWPAEIYRAVWSWDMGTIARAVALYDTEKAVALTRTLWSTQWQNGMPPHMGFLDADQRRYNRWWKSQYFPEAPRVDTSAIIQPPIGAMSEKAVLFALPDGEQREFAHAVMTHALARHHWYYRHRDPDDSGAIVLVHPHEHGLDDLFVYDPALAAIDPEMRRGEIGATGMRALRWVRNDRALPPEHRATDEHVSRCRALAQRWVAHLSRRGSAADFEFQVVSPSFLGLLVGSNNALRDIYESRGDWPAHVRDGWESLQPHVAKTEEALAALWDDERQWFSAQDRVSGCRLPGKTAEAFAALHHKGLATPIVGHLLDALRDTKAFGSKFGIPTVALSEGSFRADSYCNGPVFPLFTAHVLDPIASHRPALANRTRRALTHLYENEGPWEMYDPTTGEGRGACFSSQTAAASLLAEAALGRSTDGPQFCLPAAS